MKKNELNYPNNSFKRYCVVIDIKQCCDHLFYWFAFNFVTWSKKQELTEIKGNTNEKTIIYLVVMLYSDVIFPLIELFPFCPLHFPILM